MSNVDAREILRFGDFTLDVRAYQLRRRGRPVRLERRPMDLLILLVERRPELVTHAEIAEHLWGKDVFVDVETGIHGAIRKIRLALRDSRDTPVYVETVPAKGYRFIAVTETAPATLPVPHRHDSASERRPPDSVAAAVADARSAPMDPGRPGRHGRIAWAAGFALATLIVAALLIGKWYSGAPPARVTLAVLPFENLSGDVDRDYLAEGLAEEVVVALDKIDPERVSVIARSSLGNNRRSTGSPADFARGIGADYLVDSSIRSEGGLLRITAKLIRVRDQVQVWSQTFDRTPASVLALQQELSAVIADQIKLRFSRGSLVQLSHRHTTNADAYDLYLRGRNFANQRTPQATAKAIEYYEQAIALDRNYALAWAGIAMALTASSMNGDATPLEVFPRAGNAAAEAVRSDPDLAEAQIAQGYFDWMLGWNWPSAERALRRGIALEARSAAAHHLLGHALSQMGSHVAAAASMRRARELEPLHPMPFAMSSQVAYQARDFPAALDFAQQAIARDPEFWIGHMTRGQALERMGQIAPALDALTTAARFSGSNSKTLSLRGYLLARAGRLADARDVLTVLETAARERYVPPYAFALIHAAMGAEEAAFDWLNRAYAERDVHLIFLPVDPKWDPYRDDPRFIHLLARCGFQRAEPGK